MSRRYEAPGTPFSRAMQTRIDIFDAIGRCVERGEELDKLTVTTICKEAAVSKSTFYTYFEDKYSVVQWYMDQVYEMGVGQIGRTLSWRRGHTVTTMELVRIKNILLGFSKSADYNSINPYSRRKREVDLVSTIVEYRHAKLTPQLHAQVIALVAGETAVWNRYAEGDLEFSEMELVDCLVSLVPKDLFELLNKPLERNDEEQGGFSRSARAEHFFNRNR